MWNYTVGVVNEDARGLSGGHPWLAVKGQRVRGKGGRKVSVK